MSHELEGDSLINLIVLQHGGLTDKRLIQLTTNDPSATTTDLNVLHQAAHNALARFRVLTGIAPAIDPETNALRYDQYDVIYDGVIAVLEKTKCRNLQSSREYNKDFELKCRRIRELMRISPSSDGQFQKSEPKPNRRPYLDRSTRALNPGGSTSINGVNETNAYLT